MTGESALRPIVVFFLLWAVGVVVFGAAVIFSIGNALIDATRYGARRFRPGRP